MKYAGFEFMKTYDTVEEKTCVLILGAIKTACAMASIDFDSLSDADKTAMIHKLLK